MAKGYTTQQQVENYLQIDISEDLASQMTSWIEMVEDYIDNYTGKEFDSTTELRKFDGTGMISLCIDDATGVSSVYMTSDDATSSSGTLSNSDYHLYRFDNPNKSPYNRIEINQNGSFSCWDRGKKNIWITGTWGYSSIPSDIKMVATKLVASLVVVGKEGGAKGPINSYSEGDLTVNHGGFDEMIENDSTLKNTLEHYRDKKMKTIKLTRT